MRHPQVIVYERDALLSGMLAALVHTRRWGLRTLRQTSTCLDQIRGGGPTVLILHLGRHLEQELSLLSQVSTLYPEVATIVVGEASHVALVGSAWDLGARYVLLLPQPANWLADIVAGVMDSHHAD